MFDDIIKEVFLHFFINFQMFCRNRDWGTKLLENYLEFYKFHIRSYDKIIEFFCLLSSKNRYYFSYIRIKFYFSFKSIRVIFVNNYFTSTYLISIIYKLLEGCYNGNVSTHV